MQVNLQMLPRVVSRFAVRRCVDAFKTRRWAFALPAARYYPGHSSTCDERSRLLCGVTAYSALGRIAYHHARWMSQFIGLDDKVLEVVQKELRTEPPVKAKQLQLLSSLASDTSEMNKELVLKHNSAMKLTGHEVYTLAIALFQASQTVGPESLEIAVPLFEYGGELGEHNSAYTFAQLLRSGQGCTADPTRAAKMFTDLAMKGHPYAQFALAGMHYSGLGVEQNFNVAYTLYKVSAQNFVPQAYTILGEMHRLGQGVSENLAEAVSYYEKGAQLGDPAAHLALAQCYTHGKGLAQSYEKAFEHNKSASELGHPIGTYNVGGHYFAGKGAEQSFEKAAEFFSKAAEKGFAPAQVNLGNMYYSGMGVPKDWQKAKELYRAASDADQNAKLLLEELELEEQQQKKNDYEQKS